MPDWRNPPTKLVPVVEADQSRKRTVVVKRGRGVFDYTYGVYGGTAGKPVFGPDGTKYDGIASATGYLEPTDTPSSPRSRASSGRLALRRGRAATCVRRC